MRRSVKITVATKGVFHCMKLKNRDLLHLFTYLGKKKISTSSRMFTSWVPLRGRWLFDKFRHLPHPERKQKTHVAVRYCDMSAGRFHLTTRH